jgi:very-short-patch-repair endonuclease
MDWLFKELKYETMEDWYKTINNDLIQNCGTYLVKYGIINLTKNIYPEYKWLPWKFIQVSSGFWDNLVNQREYMDWLFKELKYETMEDWYNLTRIIMQKYNGLTLFVKNKCSSFYLLSNIFPEYEWIPWKFKKITANFWDNLENHKEYVEWLFKKLNYEKIEDWYQITTEKLLLYEGDKILRKYTSFKDLLKEVYKEYKWLPWKFIQIPIGYWEDINNNINFMNWLFTELKYKTMEDWYNLNIDIINYHTGTGFSHKYNGSIHNILKNIYPEYNWIPWKFSFCPNNYWDDIINHKKYTDWLFKELKYETMEDWYNIKTFILKEKRGYTLLVKKYNGSIKKMLKNIYPKYNWDKTKFNYLKGEKICNEFLSKNYKNLTWGFETEWCISEKTNKYYPFDFCLEEFKLIIEIDGGQHFIQVGKWNSPEETRKRDKYKMEKALENGYSVVRILQEDIYRNKNEWENNLKNSIKYYDRPQIIFLNKEYEKYSEYKYFLE